jgi:two-component system heavy metal sensor histidine kinase CusS
MIVMAATLVFGGFGWLLLQSIEEHFHDMDLQDVDEVMQLVVRDLQRMGPEVPQLTLPFDNILSSHRTAELAIYRQDGTLLFSSSDDFLKGAAVLAYTGGEKTVIHHWRNAYGSYNGISVELLLQDEHQENQPLIVVVAVNGANHVRFLQHFVNVLWLMICSGIVLMGILGWMAVRQGHRPIRNIAARIQSMSADALNERIEPAAVPLELRGLVIAFNGLLDKMESSFMRLSNFSTDIAHELRTPVTKLRTQTEVALNSARSVEAYKEVLYSNLEEYEHMARMIADMLFIAKAENGLLSLTKEPVDLVAEINGLFEYYEAWAEEQNITLACSGTGRVHGDRQMLKRVLSNLIANAIAHTRSGGKVSIQLQRQGPSDVIIDISNSGQIEQHHLPHIFDRFYRVEMSSLHSSDGVGLGLAIVKSIVELHHGQIAVTSEGGMTNFRMTLAGEMAAASPGIRRTE